MRTLGACSGDISQLLRSCATLVVNYVHVPYLDPCTLQYCQELRIVRQCICERNNLAESWAVSVVRVQVEITLRDNCYGEGNDPFSEPPQLCGEDFYDGNPIKNYQPDQFTGV